MDMEKLREIPQKYGIFHIFERNISLYEYGNAERIHSKNMEYNLQEELDVREYIIK